MIEVNKLTKTYGAVRAVDGISFRVEPGEIVGFLGPNGAGKTTTMRILTGYSTATEGTAKVAGFNVADSPVEVKRRVGYLPENVPLYTEMLVASFLRYVADIKGIAGSKRKSEIDRVLEMCGLVDMARRTIGNLSKGYRQRVGLAQALIGEPPVLILDEPTVGLDPRQIIEIRQVIKSLGQRHTVLLSTHILPEVAMICDRVIIIHRGRIVTEDSMGALTGADRSMFEVAVAGPREQAERAFRAVRGVAEVKVDESGVYLVTAAPDSDPRGALVKAALEAGLTIQGLTRRSRTLEEVFVEATTADRIEA